MWQSDIELDKYWVTQRGYFRLATTVLLGVVITDGKLQFCHVISEGNLYTKYQQKSTTTGRFITASIITLQLVLVAQI